MIEILLSSLNPFRRRVAIMGDTVPAVEFCTDVHGSVRVTEQRVEVLVLMDRLDADTRRHLDPNPFFGTERMCAERLTNLLPVTSEAASFMRGKTKTNSSPP